MFPSFHAKESHKLDMCVFKPEVLNHSILVDNWLCLLGKWTCTDGWEYKCLLQ